MARLRMALRRTARLGGSKLQAQNDKRTLSMCTESERLTNARIGCDQLASRA